MNTPAPCFLKYYHLYVYTWLLTQTSQRENQRIYCTLFSSQKQSHDFAHGTYFFVLLYILLTSKFTNFPMSLRSSLRLQHVYGQIYNKFYNACFINIS
jgi:hypothetical protein